jgi:hypothetical protein
MRIGRSLLPAGVFQRLVSKVLSIPAPGALRADPIRLIRPAAHSDRNRSGTA